MHYYTGAMLKSKVLQPAYLLSRTIVCMVVVMERVHGVGLCSDADGASRRATCRGPAGVRGRQCSKQWRDKLFVALQAWRAQHGGRAPRTARARDVPAHEANLAQQVRNFRAACRVHNMLSDEEIGVWKRVAPFIWPDPQHGGAPTWVEHAYRQALSWLDEHAVLPTSKTVCTRGASALANRLLRVKQQWDGVPDIYRSKFMALPGWQCGGHLNKQTGAGDGRLRQTRPAKHCARNNIDIRTELHTDTEDIDAAHPDRSSINRKVLTDYTIYLPHKRPGLMTTSFSDVNDGVANLLGNAACVAKRKRGTGVARTMVDGPLTLELGQGQVEVPWINAAGAICTAIETPCVPMTPPCAKDAGTSDSEEPPGLTLSTMCDQPSPAQHLTIAATDGEGCTPAVSRRRFVRPRFVFQELQRGPMDVL